MNRLVFLVALSISIFLLGCGGGKKVGGVTPATDKTIKELPWFVKKLPQDPNLHYEWGTAVSRDMSMATSQAAQDARMKMGLFLETRFQGLIESFREEVNSAEDGEYLQMFTEVSKAVVSTVLHGIKTEENDIRNEEGRFRVYVLMSMPVGASAYEFMNQVKQRQKDAYTRFRASEGLKKLEDEANRYENWKKEQGGY